MNPSSSAPRRSRSATLQRGTWGLALALCGLLGSAELAWAANPMPGAVKTIPGLAIPTQSMDEPAFAGLAPTVIESWAPRNAVAFKAAEVCHDEAIDVYSIAAVYTLNFGYQNIDIVYRIRVEGDSSDPNYGKFIDRQFVGMGWRIDHIDCTSDAAGSTFIAFDRRFEDAVWYRLTNTSRFGPYRIRSNSCLPNSAKPRIAFAGGNEPRLMVVVDGKDYGDPQELVSCEACPFVFDPYTGNFLLTPEPLWDDGIIHWDYDVEWNGDAFVIAFPFLPDGHPEGKGRLGTFAYTSEGELIPADIVAGDVIRPRILQNFLDASVWRAPLKARLVYTQHANNRYGELLLKTETGSYWVQTHGALYGRPVHEFTNPDFVACENHGPSRGLAHVFDTRTISPRDAPIGGDPGVLLASGVQRRSYGLNPAPGSSPNLLDSGYTTRACETGTTPGDEEILLVRGRSGSTRVYWSLEAP
ncbi:MAG: hypothetical protein VCB99_10840 [Myxococcota bacterium]